MDVQLGIRLNHTFKGLLSKRLPKLKASISSIIEHSNIINNFNSFLSSHTHICCDTIRGILFRYHPIITAIGGALEAVGSILVMLLTLQSAMDKVPGSWHLVMDKPRLQRIPHHLVQHVKESNAA